MKKCSKCHKNKPFECFGIRPKAKLGIRSQCKQCELEYRISNKDKISEKKRIYAAKTKNLKRKYDKKRYKELKHKLLSYQKEYYQQNKEKIKQRTSDYYQKNKSTIRQRILNKLHTNIEYKLRHYLRSRLNRAIKNKQKSGSAVRDLDCSIKELKQHIEGLFKPGMTWENYGTYGWHIDHIQPLSSFNLQKRDDFLKACNYKNLQPLWAQENLKKGARTTKKRLGEIIMTDDLWLDIEQAFDEITQKIYSPEQIKKLNKTRRTCVQCGKETKDLYNFSYCPTGCDKEIELQDLFTIED